MGPVEFVGERRESVGRRWATRERCPRAVQRLTRSNVEEFQRFCDRISEAAKVRGMTEETLDKVLSD